MTRQATAQKIDNISDANHLDYAEVGDGVTICKYSDRHACTIVKRTDKKIWVQRDKATLLNGVGSGEPDALKFEPGGFHGHTSGKQRYRYERNEESGIGCYSRREWYNDYDKKNYIRWVRVGEKRNGEQIIAGRLEFYDFNF